MTPEELRVALDGEVLSDGKDTWRVEIYSVSDQQGRRWVQMALQGEPSWVLTLRLSSEDSVEHARHALSHWLADPSEPTEEIINIA